MSDAFITCPVTGRRWPTVKRSDLKTCNRCGALIDIRFDAWMDGGAGPSRFPGACSTDPPELAPEDLTPRYPYLDNLGPTWVIGPECFADEAKTVICWQGENYYRNGHQPTAEAAS